jgi:hypothetical protein
MEAASFAGRFNYLELVLNGIAGKDRAESPIR